MSFINWIPTYNTGISQIDLQHKTLVELLNNLHDAMKAGKAKDQMSGYVKELINYSVTHFNLEEKYMKQYNFPGYLLHKKEHDDFASKVLEFQKKVESGENLVSIDVLTYIKSWLVDHMLGSDRKYIPTFLKNGLK